MNRARSPWRRTFRATPGAAALSLLVGAVAAHAQSDRVVELGEVVVSAPSADRTVRTTPHGITIITAADIARSTATSLSELLSRGANLNLQSFSGNDKRSTVDIRGMGAAASSNVLVLVDGVRLNENDLSAADLSTVPLSQIERIEILRGGGAVRYGNGAVGGVINIVTKGAKAGRASLDLAGRAGSYSTSELRLNASGGVGPFTGNVNLSGLDTDGYRQNNFLHARDASAEIRFAPTGALGFLDFFARAARHRDDTGLPGPVSAQAFASGSTARRASNSPFDRSSTEDERFTLGANADFGRAGQLQLQAHSRNRDNPFLIGYSPIVPLADQQASIASDTRDYLARYELDAQAFGHTHSLSVGANKLNADYLRRQNGEALVDRSTRRTGDVDSHGWYANAIVRAAGGLAFTGGIRFDRFSTRETDERYTRGDCQTVLETVLVDVLPGPGVILVPILVPRQTNCVDAYRLQKSQGGDWRNRGTELGVTWQATPGLTAFASTTQNFRNPNVDELLLAANDLRPQTGRTSQAGVRYGVKDDLELGVTAFRMNVENEIFFGIDPRTGLGVNFNLPEPTRRTGAEVEARWRVSESVVLRASAGYVSAKLAGSGAEVPLVPKVTAHAQAEWIPRTWLRWTFSVRYVGERHDGNDLTGTLYPMLPAYTVWDTAIRFEHGAFQLALGVNNLFNEVYSTVAYSATYYPMPERNYYAALRARF